MLKLNLYILAAASIAPVAVPGEAVTRLSANEPDYTGIIPPMQLRRMSKAVRMGIGAARECLQEAGLERPDAIVAGTALGCLADTEVFLKKMVVQEEQLLTPTPFIQSTHNTVAGQIALATGCHGYNNTIVQRGHSFENAVLCAALFLTENPGQTVLAGGVDELTDTTFGLMQRVGVYTRLPLLPEEHHPGAAGSVAGEGAGFLLLSGRANGAKTRISGLQLFSEGDTDAAAERLHHIVSAEGGLRNTDALITGAASGAGLAAYDAPLDGGQHYRERSGSWGTDTAAALARLVREWPEGKERAWLISNWGSDWCVWLLER